MSNAEKVVPISPDKKHLLPALLASAVKAFNACSRLSGMVMTYQDRPGAIYERGELVDVPLLPKPSMGDADSEAKEQTVVPTIEYKRVPLHYQERVIFSLTESEAEQAGEICPRMLYESAKALAEEVDKSIMDRAIVNMGWQSGDRHPDNAHLGDVRTVALSWPVSSIVLVSGTFKEGPLGAGADEISAIPGQGSGIAIRVSHKVRSYQDNYALDILWGVGILDEHAKVRVDAR